jgi:hypothetical protein
MPALAFDAGASEGTFETYMELLNSFQAHNPDGDAATWPGVNWWVGCRTGDSTSNWFEPNTGLRKHFCVTC